MNHRKISFNRAFHLEKNTRNIYAQRRPNVKRYKRTAETDGISTSLTAASLKHCRDLLNTKTKSWWHQSNRAESSERSMHVTHTHVTTKRHKHSNVRLGDLHFMLATHLGVCIIRQYGHSSRARPFSQYTACVSPKRNRH